MNEKQRINIEYHADHGACHYCGGRVFSTPRRWWMHLVKEHPTSQRVHTIREAIG